MKRSIKSLLAALVLSLSLATPVLAGPLEDGDAVAKRGDYATVARARKLAEQGHAAAMVILGVMYSEGKVVPQDYAKAMEWYRKAAKQGHTRAMGLLGIMYGEGEGVPQDAAKAVVWFRKAAKQGDANAQSLLAAMYEYGRGVPQDYAEAVTWYRKAAEQGDAVAQFNFGVMYAKGNGVPQDYVEAHKWVNLAASRYSASEAKLVRDQTVKVRDAITKLMTPAQIAEAQRLAREWKPKK